MDEPDLALFCSGFEKCWREMPAVYGLMNDTRCQIMNSSDELRARLSDRFHLDLRQLDDFGTRAEVSVPVAENQSERAKAAVPAHALARLQNPWPAPELQLDVVA